MAAFKLSKAAVNDLLAIGRYTLERWGEPQAVRYLSQLDACFHRIAKNPESGLPCDDLRPGYRRVLEGRHLLFYRVVRKRVQVIRILHERMLPLRHL
jgi:toxin ParE1/3/4